MLADILRAISRSQLILLRSNRNRTVRSLCIVDALDTDISCLRALTMIQIYKELQDLTQIFFGLNGGYREYASAADARNVGVNDLVAVRIQRKHLITDLRVRIVRDQRIVLTTRRYRVRRCREHEAGTTIQHWIVLSSGTQRHKLRVQIAVFKHVMHHVQAVHVFLCLEIRYNLAVPYAVAVRSATGNCQRIETIVYFLILIIYIVEASRIVDAVLVRILLCERLG